MKKIIITAILSLTYIIASRADIFQIEISGGLLTGAQEVPPNDSTAQGSEIGDGITYDSATRTLSLMLTYGMFGFNPLQGDYTGSHIHEAPTGANGPVVIALNPIQVTPQSGFFLESVVLTPALQTALFADDLYLNIHSALFPGGEIRGQLIPTSRPPSLPDPATPVTWVIAGASLVGFAALRRLRLSRCA